MIKDKGTYCQKEDEIIRKVRNNLNNQNRLRLRIEVNNKKDMYCESIRERTKKLIKSVYKL